MERPISPEPRQLDPLKCEKEDDSRQNTRDDDVRNLNRARFLRTGLSPERLSPHENHAGASNTGGDGKRNPKSTFGTSWRNKDKNTLPSTADDSNSRTSWRDKCNNNGSNPPSSWRNKTNSISSVSTSRHSRNTGTVVRLQGTGVRGRRSGQPYSMNFNNLQKFVGETTEEITSKFVGDAESCSLLLEGELSHDHIVLILNAMSKISESSSDAVKLKILHITVKKNFLKELIAFVAGLHVQDDQDKARARNFWTNQEQFFVNLQKYAGMIISTVPSIALAVLPKLLKAADHAISNLGMSEDISTLYEDLRSRMTVCSEAIRRKKAKAEEYVEEVADPPDDFREISILPLPSEITTWNEPFLRQNVVEGSYRSVEHYLDVQFRLVRNDFVKPLRDEICSYINNEKKKTHNIKLYHNVKLFKPVSCGNGASGILVQLPASKSKQDIFNLKTSKMFMYCSLVCFTKDNFKNILFGRVINRDRLTKRQLIVSLEYEKHLFDFNARYLMVECKVYFEPYYYVLKALQRMEENRFPLKEYIIDLSCERKAPEYFRRSTEEKYLERPQLHDDLSRYRLRKINYRGKRRWVQTRDSDDSDDEGFHDFLRSREQCQYRIPLNNGVINEDEWQSAEELNLNEAQYAAYKNALSQKLAIIQGPPGTGKTFLGLKVAKALIQNHQYWFSEYRFLYDYRFPTEKRYPYEDTVGHQVQGFPMLVICFTNHALDQFLEGLLPITNLLMRIGGQSKSEKLEMYNIKNLNFLRSKSSRTNIFGLKELIEELKDELNAMGNAIDSTTSLDGIVDIRPFLFQLPDLIGTWFQTVSSEELVEWLFGGDYQWMEEETVIDEGEIGVGGKLELDYGDESDMDEEVFEEFNPGDVDNYDDGFFLPVVHLPDSNPFLISISSLEEKLRSIRRQREKLLLGQSNFRTEEWNGLDIALNMAYRRTIFEQNYLMKRMEEGATICYYRPVDYFDVRRPYNVHPDDRWKMYFNWVRHYRSHLIQKRNKAEARYNEQLSKYEEMKEMSNVQLMRSRLVVGMTTTSAARLQSSLRALRAPVVIIEEAAEIMEAHVVAALTNHCEHLILIGDHQQLRPSTADYEMENKYQLGISLFERMIRNDMHCNVLEIQHRMRPEISKLICPAIYPTLSDHESVGDFPDVAGVDRNLYFIHHQNPESIAQDDSKYNTHEVNYLLRLAQYLLQNGYEPEDVTILCGYLAQLFKMIAAKREFPKLDKVRVCVLDNFQGEESKIVLLSLVRNNSDNSIGFLGIDNRVCVALSRAREGFYMMGNMDMLAGNSDLWTEIKQTLIEQDSLGEALPVRCKLHPDTVTLLKTPDDFRKVPEGGCDKRCEQQLDCGHNCKMQCHPSDREHIVYQCNDDCSKLCANDHLCPKRCYERCGRCHVNILKTSPCGHSDFYPCYLTEIECRHLVPCDLPCGHKIDKPCYIDVECFPCPQICDARIEKCGHACALNCHVENDPDLQISCKCKKMCDRVRPKCTMKGTKQEHRCKEMCHDNCQICDIVVKKVRSCSHVYDLQCSADIELLPCKKPCKKTLACGHNCRRTCSEPCGNCSQLVEKEVAECGHKIEIKCCATPSKKDCLGLCSNYLNCGHSCQEKCKDPCTINCKELVDSVVPLLCGHVAKIPCHLNTVGKITDSVELLDYCKAKCDAVLKCAHECGGSCGECHQGRIHKPCTARCGVSLVCGHVCNAECREPCPPCYGKCTYRCEHGNCNRRCGVSCKPCYSKCPRNCKHPEYSCRLKCKEICEVPPCENPCEKKLACGHWCVGFCGDPCPPLCRICDKKALAEVFFGDEVDECPRFVLLVDCGHVVESKGMKEWMDRDDSTIVAKRCPTCQASIVNTHRYREYVKRYFVNVTKVKNAFHGSRCRNARGVYKCKPRVDSLLKSLILSQALPTIKIICDELKIQLTPVEKRPQVLNNPAIQAIKIKLTLLENICALYDILREQSPFDLSPDCKNYLTSLLQRVTSEKEHYVSEQEADDYRIEENRVRRMMQLNFIEAEMDRDESKELRAAIKNKIYKLEKYDTDNDENVKKDLVELNGSVDLVEIEFKEIIPVFGVRSGAWHKCPAGHVYVNGVADLSKCTDCQSRRAVNVQEG